MVHRFHRVWTLLSTYRNQCCLTASSPANSTAWIWKLGCLVSPSTVLKQWSSTRSSSRPSRAAARACNLEPLWADKAGSLHVHRTISRRLQATTQSRSHHQFARVDIRIRGSPAAHFSIHRVARLWGWQKKSRSQAISKRLSCRRRQGTLCSRQPQANLWS